MENLDLTLMCARGLAFSIDRGAMIPCVCCNHNNDSSVLMALASASATAFV